MRGILYTTGIGVAAALALLSSCTAERVSEAPGREKEGQETVKGKRIQFGVTLDAVTKVQPVNDEQGIDAFRVTALKRDSLTGTYAANNYFSDMLVTRGTNGWTTQSAVYWPAAAEKSVLDFYAYTPADLNARGVDIAYSRDGIAVGQVRGFEVDTATAVREHSDLMLGFAYGKDRDEVVGLRFRHALSQIEVRAKTVEQLDVRVLGVKLGRISPRANLQIPVQEDGDLTWSEWATTTLDYFCGVTGPDTDNDTIADNYIALGTETAVNVLAQTEAGAQNEAFMMIPQTLDPWTPAPGAPNAGDGAYLSILCQIRNHAGGVTTQQLYPRTPDKFGFMAIPLSPREGETQIVWEPGKKYVYTVFFNSARGRTDPQPTDVPGPQREEMEPFVEQDNGTPGDWSKLSDDAAEVTVSVEVVDPWGSWNVDLDDWEPDEDIPVRIQ